MYWRLANKDELRQSVVDAVEVLSQPPTHPKKKQLQSFLISQSCACSSMVPCSVMTAEEYMATTQRNRLAIECPQNDVDVMFNDMMTRAVATHHNTGQYMLDGQTVDYSVRVSSVWEVTNQGVSLITANWAPMGWLRVSRAADIA